MAAPGDFKVVKQVPRPAHGADDELADSLFLTALGKRVREIREQRGLARKVLSQQASISERYIAQLEAGEGNISILLLRHVAQALGVSLTDVLITDQPNLVEHRLIRRFLERLPAHRLEDAIFRLLGDFGVEESARSRRIALIGLRGAGKSTLGKMLASELKVPFLELDREIEREAGLPLSEIFLLYGQAGYRRIEARSLERALDGHERCVISAGGGIVSEAQTYKLLLSRCFTIWLRAAPEEHMARVIAQGDSRPMAGNEEAMDDLRRILSAREPLYAKADAIVDTSGESSDGSLRKLRELIKH
jgi:XRE family aerobic/anaerobic benzoate catabolism transcriptional regulator